MPTISQTELDRLESIMNEPALPSALAKDLKAAKKVLDDVIALDADASRECRRLLDSRNEYRKTEHLRQLEALNAGKKITPDDILNDLAMYEASHALAVSRCAVTRQMVNRHASQTGFALFKRHSAAVLSVVAEAVVNDEMTPALIDAWGRAESSYRWRTPLVHKFYRFSNLRAHQITPVMRRCWEDLHRGAVATTELDHGLVEIRFLDEWPEFAEMPQ